MFSVILEGCAIFNSNRNNIVSQNSHVVRFLTMFDFNASWNDANLDRLITDHNNPYVPSNALDPVDNTYVQLNHKKIFQPNVTYKKFFTFKLPEKLLDCTCYHGFVKHLQLPPTLGISRYEIITNLRRKWKSKDNEPPNPILDPDHPSYRFASLANDFAPTDSSISYSISARVIGKASDYKSLCKQQIINANEDEYVVANEDYCYLRVIPSTNSIFELNRSMIDEEAKSFYINLKQRIEEKLELGKQLSSIPLEERLSGPTPPPLEPTASALEISKMEQSYYSKIRKANGHHNNGFYEVFLPHRKKVVFGPSKVLGLIAFTTRKTTYRVDYTSLSKFNTTNKPLSSGSKISIPLEITYVPTGSSLNNIPEFKKITVDLMILTIKSKRLPIPLVFLPEMLFENSQKESDNFDVITIKRFQKYAMDLSKLLKEFGESLQVEKDLIYDLKCLANLSTKYDVLKLPNVSYSAPDSNVNNTLLSSIPWQKENLHSSSESSVRHFKKFNLNLDIADAIPAPSSTPGSSEFCLVPDFQFCCLSRLYYLKLTLKTQANEKINLHVPLVLQRSNGKQ
ncbi:Bul1 N terminus-domain-containing protein [Scheffersomyces coipomensis]|uniref:Bul1 N terminus-domain-containing protein n=1 Tax=Scheffersomyces coipomensis TaxID=1788519 RepID=UPI00315D27A4